MRDTALSNNAGIITIATTNHPERLDPSLVDRPSRFDRKYHFELPGPEERKAYIQFWNVGLQSELRLTEAGIERIATLTDEFSFAYLKEVFVSSIMRWINTPDAPGQMDTVMVAQVAVLRDQMSSMITEQVSETGGREEVDSATMRRFMMRRYGVRRY